MLADLVPVILETRLRTLPLTQPERHARWVAKNRAHVNAYKRAWRQKRREQGLEVT